MRLSKDIPKVVRARIARHKERRMGVAKKKVLLLLLGGLSLGLSGSPRTSWKIIGALAKEWEALTKQSTERAVNSLFASKLVATKENTDGTLTLVLSENGRKKALTYNLSNMKIAVPSAWDKLWRVISSDIPENKKVTRDALREHFLELGFYELHDSVFVHPFNCFNEVEYIAQLYDVRENVCCMLATHIDGERKLKRFFHLNP